MARGFTATGGGSSTTFTVPANLTVTGTWTVSVRLHLTSYGASTFLSSRYPHDASFDIQVQSNYKLTGDIGDGTNWINTNLGGSITLSTGVWYNIIQVTTPTGTSRYINNSTDGTWSWSSNTPVLVDSTHQLALGNFYGGIVGSIAELAVWNAALSAGERGALSGGARSNRVHPEALVGYWPLFGLQSPEPDLSGNGNSGTLNNPLFATHAPVTQFTPKKVNNTIIPASSTFVGDDGDYLFHSVYTQR